MLKDLVDEVRAYESGPPITAIFIPASVMGSLFALRVRLQHAADSYGSGWGAHCARSKVPSRRGKMHRYTSPS